MFELLITCSRGINFQPDLGSGPDHFSHLLGPARQWTWPSCQGEKLVTKWKSSPASLKYIEIDIRRQPMLSPGHLHHSPANFLQLDFGGVEGKGGNRRRNGKGVRDKGSGNGTRPSLEENRRPWLVGFLKSMQLLYIMHSCTCSSFRTCGAVWNCTAAACVSCFSAVWRCELCLW